MKNNKIYYLISSLVILLPSIFGFLFWDRLPTTMITHFGADGVPDGSSDRMFVVLGFPCIFLAMHLFCLLISFFMEKITPPQNSKIMHVFYWMIPVLSLASSAYVYAFSLGYKFSATGLILLPIALIFIFIGNYLPKTTQNLMVGIKVKWTLESEENWNATHRFGGKVMFFGGILLLFMMLLPIKYFIVPLIAIIFSIAFLPILYSYLFYQKQKKTGTLTIKKNDEIQLAMKKSKQFAIPILIAVLILVSVLMFCGSLEWDFQSTQFQIDATFADDLNFPYEAVKKIELLDEFSVGVRTFGVSSPRFLMGTFQNDSFGSYTLYAYTSAESYVVLHSESGILVLGGKDKTETEWLYKEFQNRISSEAWK